MSGNQLNFNHILLMSHVIKRSHGLARALQKYLQEPRFSYLNPGEDAFPDRLFNWWDIDLVIVDLSKDKASIYKWYSEIGRSEFMPPTIFLAHPASYSNAGSFYRAGASDYLELRGLKNAHLQRSLAIIAKSIADRSQSTPESTSSVIQDTSDNTFALKLKPSGEKSASQSAATSKESSSNENRADFLNTGIINILERDKLDKIRQK